MVLTGPTLYCLQLHKRRNLAPSAPSNLASNPLNPSPAPHSNDKSLSAEEQQLLSDHAEAISLAILHTQRSGQPTQVTTSTKTTRNSPDSISIPNSGANHGNENQTLQSQPLAKYEEWYCGICHHSQRCSKKPSLAQQRLGQIKSDMKREYQSRGILIRVTIEKVQVQMQVYFPVLRINLRTKTLTTMIVLISPILCQELPIMMPTAPRRP
nr:BFH_HP1_G0048460.mRNA.1.CDS.1 [Saccharomyces cerevisiae]